MNLIKLIPCVEIIAKKNFNSARSDLEKEDFLGYGYIGLMESFLRYDKNRDDASPSFITMRVKGAIKDYVKKEKKFKNEVPFEENYKEKNIINLKNLWFEKVCHSIESDIYIRKFVLFLNSIMNELENDERVLLKEYYFNGKSLEEIGKMLSLSRSGVCKKHKRLLMFLKKKFLEFNERKEHMNKNPERFLK